MDLESQIAKAHADPGEVPALCRVLADGHILAIATWPSLDSKEIILQDFKKEGRSFIPIFSDAAHFRTEIAGSGFEDKGVSMDYTLLATILHGHELLILNPRSKTPVELRKADLVPFAKRRM